MQTRIVVQTIASPEAAFPSEKRAMAGRRAFPVTSGGKTILRWPGGICEIGAAKFRLTAAVDERSHHRVEASIAASGEALGTIDVMFACPGQVFGLDLSAEQAGAAFRDGLALTLVDDSPPLWFTAPGPNTNEALQPHLASAAGPGSLETFLALFCSVASVQPCDWMGVCVLDGLQDWAAAGRADAAQALDQHLAIHFHPETGRRENFRSQPCDGAPGGPETTGPFAVLALRDPEHPALALAEEGFVKHYAPGVEAVGHRVVAETSYNIAYPMMALAVFSGKDQYFARAIRQLEVNHRYLAEPDALWLRYSPDSGERTFRSWSRGVAWYFLGLVRTLSLLSPADRPPHLVAEAGRMAEWAGLRQNAGSLWPCFFDEREVLPDASGCAGIAAAIALGVRQGMIDSRFLPVARAAYETLSSTHLEPDGWLRGVSQSNKPEAEGIDLQRSKFRVIAPWGMGLFAQLAAALGK